MFPIPIIVPIGLTIIAALFGDRRSAPPQRHTKSIEVCTADCRAQWIREDGVLRVYQGTGILNCAAIIVEVDPARNTIAFPGDVQGHPVHVRMRPELRA